jgi:hypothetical protein
LAEKSGNRQKSIIEKFVAKKEHFGIIHLFSPNGFCWKFKFFHLRRTESGRSKNYLQLALLQLIIY